MSPHRNISFLNLRWTALWLVLLQFGMIGLGHPLHQWMHESAHLAAGAAHSSHGTCGGCPAETTDSQASDSRTVCCSSTVKEASDEGAQNSPDINGRGTGLNSPAPHRCWSWDCTFFRGMHQPLTVTQPASLVGLDLRSFELSLPSDLFAEIGEHFSLRARGPPQA